MGVLRELRKYEKTYNQRKLFMKAEDFAYRRDAALYALSRASQTLESINLGRATVIR